MFSVSTVQAQQIDSWYKSLIPTIVEVQKRCKSFMDDPFIRSLLDRGEPYYGAMGGGLTYSFTPTGLGVIVKITEAITGEEIDVTDYDTW